MALLSSIALVWSRFGSTVLAHRRKASTTKATKENLETRAFVILWSPVVHGFGSTDRFPAVTGVSLNTAQPANAEAAFSTMIEFTLRARSNHARHWRTHSYDE